MPKLTRNLPRVMPKSETIICGETHMEQNKFSCAQSVHQDEIRSINDLEKKLSDLNLDTLTRNKKSHMK